MKKAILLIFILTGPAVLFAQNLTMSQLLEIKKKDIGNAEDYLVSKGWEFLEAKEPTWDKFGSVAFTYEKDNMSSRAVSFLIYLFSDVSSQTRVLIQVHKKEKYTEYVNAIKSYGCEMVSSKVENNEIVKVYRGATTTFIIRSGTSENYFNEQSAVWTFSILSNDDYDLNYGIDY